MSSDLLYLKLHTWEGYRYGINLQFKSFKEFISHLFQLLSYARTAQGDDHVTGYLQWCTLIINGHIDHKGKYHTEGGKCMGMYNKEIKY